MLCCSRNDKRREIWWLESRYLVLWSHPFRYALWLSAFLRPRYPSPLQEDLIRLLHFSQISLIKCKRSDFPYPEWKPTWQILNKWDQKPPMAVSILTKTEHTRHNHRIQQNPNRARCFNTTPTSEHRPRLRLKMFRSKPTQQCHYSLLPIPKKIHKWGWSD